MYIKYATERKTHQLFLTTRVYSSFIFLPTYVRARVCILSDTISLKRLTGVRNHSRIHYDNNNLLESPFENKNALLSLCFI